MCDKSKKGVDEDEEDGEDKRDSDLRKTDRRLKRKLNRYLITYRTTVKPKRTMEAFNKPFSILCILLFITYLPVIFERVVTWRVKKRDLPHLSLGCLFEPRGLVSHLIPLDFFGLGSDFLRQSKGCDSVHALECLSDINQRPASSTTHKFHSAQ